MNIQEACSILGIEEGSSKDEVKKAFKKKAIEYHPDKNKAADAEQKFKDINNAYQLLDKHGTIPISTNVNSEFYDHSADFAEELRRRMDFMNFGFGRPIQFHSNPIIIPLDIPFEMSVLGGVKEINYERTIKCNACNNGKISVNKVKCTKCEGKGYRTYGTDDKNLPCTTCGGTGSISNNINCKECGGSGTRKSLDTLKITIPPGVISSTKLILKNKGNYNDTMNIYDNVIVVISVLPDKELQLSGNDVISVIEISLLEALQGTKKTIRTVKGDKILAFKPKTKNKETIRVAGFGVPPNGAHTIIVNVSYPDNVDELINVLINKQEPQLEEISGVQNEER